MALINCPECNSQISDKAKACPKCGASQNVIEKIKCEECNSEIAKESVICQNCGIDIVTVVSSIENNATPLIQNSPPKETNLYKCRHCGTTANEYSEFCPNCFLNINGLIRPGVFECKWCKFRTTTWSDACPRCKRDITGNIRNASGQIPQQQNFIPPQQIFMQSPNKRGGVAGIIIFGILGVVLILIGIALSNQMNSMSGRFDQLRNLLDGNSNENQMMKLASTGSIVLGGVFLLISLIKLIKR